MEQEEKKEEKKEQKADNKTKSQKPVIIRYKGRKRNLLGYLFPILLIFALIGAGSQRLFMNDGPKQVGLSDLYKDAQESKVESFEVCKDKVEAKYKDSKDKKIAVKGTTDFEDTLYSKDKLGLSPENVPVSYCTEPIDWAMVVNNIFTILLFGGLILMGVFLIRSLQSRGNEIFSFGKSKAKVVFGKKPDLTFKDVANYDEAKEELREVVLFLKEPKRFMKLGARIPKGLLLVGPPGTGKTYFARAVAGEAGVPFFHTSGAEFEEMLVGAGASRVRDLFAKAKRAAPALIFVDEIDAVARKRGTTVQTSSTEQTLNQILVEMDGFERNENVIVIAATNRPDVLDPAILRPGRFDRRIVLDLPDVEGRRKILEIHAKNKPLADDVDLEKIAKRTVGFSGADLENMLNEAAIITAKARREKITYADIDEATTKVVVGPERKRKRTEKDINIIAYHESGHAVVSRSVPEADPVHKITIISRGMSQGSTMYMPKEDEVLMSKTKMLSEMRSLLAGRASEEVFVGDISSGASNDIERASDLARRMIMKYGMSEKLGLVEYGKSDMLEYLGYAYNEQRDYSEETSREIDEEVKRLVDEAYSDAKEILKKNKDKVTQLAELLKKVEVVEGDEFEKIMKE